MITREHTSASDPHQDGVGKRSIDIEPHALFINVCELSADGSRSTYAHDIDPVRCILELFIRAPASFVVDEGQDVMVKVEGHVTSPYSEQRDGDNHPAHRGAAAAWSSEPAVHARREGHHMYPISDALHEERSELGLGHGEATHLAKCEEKRRDTVWLAEMFRVLRLSQRLYKRSHADGSESASPTSIQGV